jgi:hypothetical protein
MEGLAMKKGMGGKGKQALGTLVGQLFAIRTYAHIAHLKTGSYSQHVALDEFYTDIVDLADSIAEVGQGLYGKLDIPMVNVSGNVDKPANVLENQLNEIKKLRMNCDNKGIQAIVDNVEILFSTTIYKLKELS